MSGEAKKLQQLQTLVELSTLINSSLETSVIRRRAIEAASRLMGAETGSLLLLDRESGELYFEVALGEQGEKLRQVRLAPGQGIAGWVAEHGEAVVVNDPQNDPRFYRGADMKSSFVTRSLLCAPLKSRNRLLGVLQALNRLDGEFDADDLAMFQVLADQVAPAIENAMLYEELRETFHGTALALAESLEKRDAYTAGHTRRVSQYSQLIGRSLGLAPQELEQLHLAAVLHDIGKIGIRDDVLLKQGRLDSAEQATMHRHPHFGGEILDHVRQLREVIPGVRCHHENFDGSGYPEGLRGEEIPLAARIIAAADCFDAMTTDRPYRKGLTFDTAFAELQRCSGSQFDPQVVTAFLAARQRGEL